MNDNQHLSQKVLSAFRWLAAGKFLGQMINWGLTLYVIRLLTPADYGLMAMATLFISLLTLLNELGLGASIIQAPQIEQTTLQQIFAIVLIINTFSFLLLFSAAPFIALFFHEQKLIPIVRVLSGQFLLMAFIVIPQALLARDLRFKQRSLVEFIANLVGGFTTLGLALAGQGVWALVVGNMSLCASQMVLLTVLAPFCYRPIFSLRGMHKVISYGGLLMVERVLGYFYSQADVFIIGKILGKELLGMYSVGTDLASLPAQKIYPIISQVIFPAFSRVQHQPEEVTYYALKGVRLLSLFAFPVFWGMSSIAAELIAIVLGEKWMLATPPLTWVSLVFPLLLINATVLSVLKSLGRADASLKNMLIAPLLMPFAFFIGCHWGLPGVSRAWIIAYPLCFLITLRRSIPYIGLRLLDISRVMWKPVLASLLMYLAVSALKFVFNGHFAPLFELVLLVSAGAAVYGGLQFWINREGLEELIGLVRKI